MSLLGTLARWLARLEALDGQFQAQLTAQVAQQQAWLETWGTGAGLPPACQPLPGAPGEAWDAYNQSWHEFGGGVRCGRRVEPLGDPRPERDGRPSGHQHTVDNGAEHFWIDNAGTIHGTDSWCPPDYANDYHELTPL